MDIRDIEPFDIQDMRRPLPKPSIIHTKGDKSFFVDTNYLPVLYILAAICFSLPFLGAKGLLKGWLCMLILLGCVGIFAIIGSGYRYEFTEDGITCKLLRPGFLPDLNNDIRNRGWFQLQLFDAESVSQAGLIRCKHTVYIRVAFEGCKPFTEPWIWLHLLRNVGKVLVLRIRKAEAERADALICNYFFHDNLPIYDDSIEKKAEPVQFSHEKRETVNVKWFWFLIVYWLISLAMIPAFGCTSDRKYDAVLSVFGIMSFAAFALFLLVPSLRHQMVVSIKRMFSRSTYRELSTKRKWFFGFLCLLLAALFGITAYCMHRLDAAGGVPDIYAGGYCIWNHRFIRAISREEYRSLCLLENLQSTCGRATFPTLLLILECFAET